jgi:hypothetical protein
MSPFASKLTKAGRGNSLLVLSELSRLVVAQALKAGFEIAQVSGTSCFVT